MLLATKFCRGCEQTKALSDFAPRYDAPNASYRSRCKKCLYVSSLQRGAKLRENQDAWCRKNRPSVNAQQRDRRKKTPENNRDSFRAWRLKNMSHCAERSRRRDFAKRKATPPWADRDAILAIYERARELTRLTGIPHEVDHIYPLVSDVMCGLHVACNLQVLTKSENSAKKNRVLEGATCL